MKFATVTIGCRVNLADTLRAEEQMRVRGAERAPVEQADVVLVNTCSVTAGADQGVRQTIRRIARLNPGAKIVATGCYATRRPDEVAALPGVVRLVPNARKDGADWLSDLPDSRTTAERFGGGQGPCGEPAPPGALDRTVFTLRIQTGCEERCSYCIIPSTRGRGRSLPPGEVLEAASRAARAGYREIVLTGVHLGSYGRDLTSGTDLPALLRRLDSMGSDVRFRLSSLEPMDCPAAVVDLVARSARFAPHFHLPLQHASDAVLRAMQRPYGIGDYRRLVDAIRERLPHAAIGSDIIVGFPGETDDDVERLCAYLETSPLTSLHVFPYSERPGTAAAALPGRVRGETVRARGMKVRHIARDLADRFRRGQLGRVHRALTLEDGTLALTGNYLKARIPPGVPPNRWVDIRLREAGATMTGDVLSA